MYASTHQMMHLMQQVTILKITLLLFVACSYWYTIYSKIALIRLTTAIMKLPNASEPRWYFTAQPILWVILTPPSVDASSLPCLKYHIQAVAPIVNCYTAIVKATTQKNPNRLAQKRYSVYFSYVTAQIKEFSLKYGVPMLIK